jgi:hypothetical protein
MFAVHVTKKQSIKIKIHRAAWLLVSSVDLDLIRKTLPDIFENILGKNDLNVTFVNNLILRRMGCRNIWQCTRIIHNGARLFKRVENVIGWCLGIFLLEGRFIVTKELFFV